MSDSLTDYVIGIFRDEFTPMPRRVSERLAATSSTAEAEAILTEWIEEGFARIDQKLGIADEHERKEVS